MRLTKHMHFRLNINKMNLCLKCILLLFYLTLVFTYFYNLTNIIMNIVLCLSSLSTINE